MKEKQLELLKKVKKGELTPEQAQKQLLCLFSVSASFFTWDRKPVIYVEREMLIALKNLDHVLQYIKKTKRINKGELNKKVR